MLPESWLTRVSKGEHQELFSKPAINENVMNYIQCKL